MNGIGRDDTICALLQKHDNEAMRLFRLLASPESRNGFGIAPSEVKQLTIEEAKLLAGECFLCRPAKKEASSKILIPLTPEQRKKLVDHIRWGLMICASIKRDEPPAECRSQNDSDPPR